MFANSLPFITALLPLLALTTQAAAAHSNQPPHLRHKRILHHRRDIENKHPHVGRAQLPPRSNAGHADAKKLIKKSVKKRGQTCRTRGSSYSTSSNDDVAAAQTLSSSSYAEPASSSSAWSDDSSSSSDVAAATPVAATLSNEQAWAPQITSSSDDWSASTIADSWSSSATSSSAWTQPTSSNSGSSSGSSSSGLLSITDSICGYSNPDADSPNGSEDWLNCGLDGAGWTPPMVTVDELIAAELTTDGVFSPCADYIDLFNQYADQYGLKGIMLASFAMQESTCNPSVTGGNGEAGLMQLASENCGGAPNGNCYDVNFNIQRAAELFSGLISSNGGNVLLAIGSYNGWYSGLTYASGTAAASRGQCSAQNNLDYIHQFCNGWMQNKGGYTLGTYFNLKSC
ncbi:transglycosylase SLT domain-containing protein [Cryptococcus neoformans]|uniref:Transglycosylase SLT domain-containing protein n=1 Tax=Cryptococcus neoformans Tu259-1 TaxID=1230072 RepID=A0A854Q7Q9_CRYNE|nr:transglycosylase SLT domain-containing protein [Cryptococcus neoformans var. grubii 125.91]OXG13270.1 transglycosylase SLT domain-containing protein [Cryptococcus neoformans var. grubii Tu401-1]OXG14406.1 transglycosylase SLT domain-containing protein [Cryptococcus neoformans var. grubii Tu259-1]OXG28450.1 transglycosylase SLT domain-containing protein [Cryptococcus neoformans var. grubii Bt15]OXG35456.1 transglycosylase SLT domain-containing protein [Cryptococcus neoformans var. grubii Bt12